MKAVMYHYVRPGPDDPPYEYYYLDLADFRKQLDHLAAEYELINRKTFLDCVIDGSTPPEDAAVLTFDDGLLDHHEYVLPELRSRDLWGLFFVPGPIGEELLSVHRIHTLLGTNPAPAVDRTLREIVGVDDVRAGHGTEFKQMYAGSESEEPLARVKWILNFFLPYDRVVGVLDALEERFPEARVDPNDIYMTPEQISALADAGMLVGGHTVRHRVLSRLSPAEQREEIQQSFAYVDEAVGRQPIRSFAYPYGGAGTFDDATLSALRDSNCDIAFTTESADISTLSLRESPLTLARRDCNEFPHGGASRY